jgi:hypothetical protein
MLDARLPAGLKRGKSEFAPLEEEVSPSVTPVSSIGNRAEPLIFIVRGMRPILAHGA